jgi:hypothetical protein
MALRSSYRDNTKPTVLADDSVEEEYSLVAEALRKSLREFGSEAT